MNERCQRMVIDQDYTDEELGVRDRLWCRSYAPVVTVRSDHVDLLRGESSPVSHDV